MMICATIAPRGIHLRHPKCQRRPVCILVPAIAVTLRLFRQSFFRDGSRSEIFTSHKIMLNGKIQKCPIIRSGPRESDRRCRAHDNLQSIAVDHRGAEAGRNK